MKKNAYTVKSKVWIYPGGAAWHFVNIDKKQSKELKETYGKHSRGFGSIPVEVTCGKSKWGTSLFPDRQSETYLLPLKRSVRIAEDISEGDAIKFLLKVNM